MAILSIDAGGQDTTGLKMQIGPSTFPSVSFGLPIAFAPTYQINLSAFPSALLNGPNTVYVRFIDAAGNLSDTVTATLCLDIVPPVDGCLIATGENQQVSLIWAGFSDARSGLKYYKLYCSTKGFPDVTKDPMIYQTGQTSFIHPNLKKGTT